jgi:hypothetical protein
MTYLTIEEEAKIRAKKLSEKKPGKEKQSVKPLDKPKKEPKDLSHIQGFRCKQYNHYSTLKECPLHPKHAENQARAQGFANTK